MKKLFTLLLVALVGMLPMMAETVTVDFEDLSTLDPTPVPNKNGGPGQPAFVSAQGTYTCGKVTIEIDNTTAKFQKQSGATWFNYYNTTNVKFTPADGYVINSISTTAKSGYENYLNGITISEGEGTIDNGVYTAPEGGVTSVTLKNSGSTMRCTKFVVELTKTEEAKGRKSAAQAHRLLTSRITRP